jgi:1-acyl-sn-glycerol-3-phosphate acyltransferase
VGSFFIDSDVAARVDRLEIPFNRFGVDPYGISRDWLCRVFTQAQWLYRRYFTVRAYGLENVPARGRAMLVGNHAGGVALDAGTVIASMFFDLEPPRLAQGMVEKFVNRLPFMSKWAARAGQFTGLPEHAERLLGDERMLMVFPEGARGTAKLFPQRYSLVDFGTGFLRLALETRTPIVPFAFIGGGEAIPTMMNAYELGKRLGAPYVPITPYLLPIPLPVPLSVHCGKPMHFPGDGREEDEVMVQWVDDVKREINRLIYEGLEERRRRVDGSDGAP